MQIVLAKLIEDLKIVRPGQPDLGIASKFVPVQKPVAMMWLRDGTSADVEKAKTFADSDGYNVYMFDSSEEDPLGMAKKLIMGREHKHEKHG